MGSAEPIVVNAEQPAVALETAFLTSGLPETVRLNAADRMDAAVRAAGANPAFVGILEGRSTVGLEPAELDRLSRCGAKLSTRDLPAAVARGATGGTTVAATLFLAQRAGLTVAATGGIGGVHIGPGPEDVSVDLLELSRTPIVLVCSGAKAMLDLPATIERLESLGITIAGFGTDQLPAFWSAESGITLDLTVDSAADVAELWQAARSLATPGAILVCVPPPADAALTRDESEKAVSRALAAARAQGIAGPEVTPFLLARIAEHTHGRSVEANLALLERNAKVAGEIAVALLEH